MQRMRSFTALSVLSAIVTLSGVAPLCATTQVVKPMPCCVRSSHCAAGLSAATGCCRLTPSPAKGQAQPRADGETGRRAAKIISSDIAADWSGAALRFAAAAIDAPRFDRIRAVPIFLLNSTLLR